MTKPEHWHVEKGIPLSLIVAIMIQTSLGVWWAADLSARAGELTRRVVKIENANERQWERLNLRNHERISLIARMNGVEMYLKRVDGTLQTLSKRINTLQHKGK